MTTKMKEAVTINDNLDISESDCWRISNLGLKKKNSSTALQDWHDDFYYCKGSGFCPKFHLNLSSCQ